MSAEPLTLHFLFWHVTNLIIFWIWSVSWVTHYMVIIIAVIELQQFRCPWTNIIQETPCLFPHSQLLLGAVCGLCKRHSISACHLFNRYTVRWLEEMCVPQLKNKINQSRQTNLAWLYLYLFSVMQPRQPWVPPGALGNELPPLGWLQIGFCIDKT